MDLSFAALKAGIEEQIVNAKILENVGHTARSLLDAHRTDFMDLQTKCGVPAIWTMCVFERENPSMRAYLGNGDPWNEKTTHVPRGRGPFNSWVDGAIDALTLDHMIGITPWDWARACYEWERWNGFGPRRNGRPTGYVWAGTDQYHGGKYVQDGVWSRGTWDHQIGCFVLGRAIAAEDPVMGGALLPPEKPQMPVSSSLVASASPTIVSNRLIVGPSSVFEASGGGAGPPRANT